MLRSSLQPAAPGTTLASPAPAGVTRSGMIKPVVDRIVKARRAVRDHRAALAAITGIDASGKGYLAARVADGLRAARAGRFDQHRRLAQPARGPLRSPEPRPALLRSRNPLRRHVRAARPAPARAALDPHRRGLRRGDGDGLPPADLRLRRRRRDPARGHLPLKRAFQPLYDLSFWVDCSFETALERAIARGQEGLAAEATISAYRTIYFSAQEIHIARDDPRHAATDVIPNDPRLEDR